MARRRGWAFVLLTLVVAGCGGADPEPVVPSHVPATPPVRPSQTAEPGERVAVPVYYVAETAAGFRLQREFHAVVTSDPASAAVREMLAGPTGTDPDYRNRWPPGAALREPVHRDGGAIVVDLTGVGPAQVGSELAELTVQQLVFTVQGALQSTDPVRILVDGARVPELWGTVDTSGPVERGDPYALRSLVQIDAPADGARVGREVEVRGEAAVFEATVLWEVLRDGSVVQEGFTSTAEGQRFAPFAFTVTLEPGDYTVRIREDDPSDGEGRPVLSDDKRFTVIG
jgi:Immunoglobulin-like domain of bacterial spore germination/Sporulation and spore germination